MDTVKENEFWKWVNQRFHSYSEELQKTPVESNRREKEDGRRPPVPPRNELKLKIWRR